MASENVIVINGKAYDAKTGLPVATPARPATKPTRKIAVATSKKVTVKAAPKTVKPVAKAPAQVRRAAPHRPAKSRTLNRTVVKKPAVKTVSAPRHPAAPKTIAKPVAPRVAVRPSPIVPRAAVKRRAPAPIRPVKPAPIASAKPVEKKNHLKTTLISFAALIVLVGGSLALYFFVPSVSTWVAASRANVRATLPVYTPDSYHVDGPADSSPGQVTISYRSVNDSTYSITQQNSNWDSVGVLENKVKPVAKNYQTLTQRGLTIYRYNDKAIWVNGGVLYTISDGNNLSNEQILKIVESF
ncbi:hypothetical protein FACS189431_1240 [Alphaproteobacteria bacterium]|nr:hypothetical protein FACS189431_1240 [Alphaproteobacteria bacterium]